MTLLRIPWEVCATVAERLDILDNETGARTRWVPNAEQIAIWKALEAHPWAMFGKPRRIGATTAVMLYNVLWTSTADAMGHNVSCGVVLQDETKTKERVALAADFCKQLRPQGGVGFVDTTESITFANGARILGVTAGGKSVGRSGGFQRLHHSELPYWPSSSTYVSLMPTLSLNGECTVETTFDLDQPNGHQARDLWRQQNAYHKHFFSVEGHEEYRKDPMSISDGRWREAQALGYTDRSAAAWFFGEAVPNKAAGDMLRALREYPQIEEHMFQSSAGRFISGTPEVLTPDEVLAVPGLSGEWDVEVFIPRDQTSQDVLIGVDTATGKERDSSAIVVIDRKDAKVCAAFASNTIQPDDLARVVHAVQVTYTKPALIWNTVQLETPRVPVAYVEDNGIGEATVQACERLGVVVQRVTTTEESKYAGLLECKRMIESGMVRGPKRLAEECDDLHRDDLGRFKGMKDMLMALGFVFNARKVSPYAPPVLPDDGSRIRHMERIRRSRGQAWS